MPKRMTEEQETHMMQLVAISTAAIGYFKRNTKIVKKYKSVALSDVIDLYEKYDKLYKENEKLKQKIAQKGEKE